MTGAERFWMNTVLSINEAIAKSRRLALNPCVTVVANIENNDQLMHFAEKGQQYLRSMRDNIQDLRFKRDERRNQPDKQPTSDAASSSTDHQHDQTKGPPGANDHRTPI